MALVNKRGGGEGCSKAASPKQVVPKPCAGGPPPHQRQSSANSVRARAGGGEAARSLGEEHRRQKKKLTSTQKGVFPIFLNYVPRSFVCMHPYPEKFIFVSPFFFGGGVDLHGGKTKALRIILFKPWLTRKTRFLRSVHFSCFENICF